MTRRLMLAITVPDEIAARFPDAYKFGQEVIDRALGYRDGTAEPRIDPLNLDDAGWDIGGAVAQL